MAEDNKKVSEGSETDASVSSRFRIILFFGFTFVVLGVIVILVTTAFNGSAASFSGFIFIGPFPILIGLGPDWNWLVAIGVAIAALSIGLFVIMQRRI